MVNKISFTRNISPSQEGLFKSSVNSQLLLTMPNAEVEAEIAKLVLDGGLKPEEKESGQPFKLSL